MKDKLISFADNTPNLDIQFLPNGTPINLSGPNRVPGYNLH